MGTETLSTVRSRIRTRLQDPQKRLWADADLNQYINLACADLQERTQWMEDWYGTLVQNAVANYNRNTDLIQNMRYQVFDTVRIDAVDVYNLDKHKPDWRQDGSNVPTRIYRSDWDTDTLYPTPNTTGDQFTYSSELGTIVEITLSGAVVESFNQETGIIVDVFDSQSGDGFFQERITYADNTSDSHGIFVQIISPYGNLINVFSRYPDSLVNDTDLLPFSDWSHYALEEFVLSLCFAKEGDGQNLKLADAHMRMYTTLWVPFVHRMVNSRTPDHPLIWRGQDPYDPHVANYSTITPSFQGIAGR